MIKVLEAMGAVLLLCFQSLAGDCQQEVSWLY